MSVRPHLGNVMALTLLVGALTAPRIAQAQVNTAPAEASSSSDSGHHRRHHSSDDSGHHSSSSSDDSSGHHHRSHRSSSDDGSHHSSSSDDSHHSSSSSSDDSGHHRRRHASSSSSHEASAPVTPAEAPVAPAPTPRAAAPEAPTPPPAAPVEATAAPEAPTTHALVAAPPEAPAAPAEAAPEPAAAESPAQEPPRTPLPVRPSRPLSLARVSHGPVDSWKFLAGFAGLAAALWYWKRRDPSASASPAPELQVVRRAALGNRGEVVVIDVAGQRILLGVTPTSVQMLTMLDEPAAPRATETVADDAGMSFEARLTAAHALASARDDARRSRHTMPGVAPDRDYDRERESSRDYDRDYDRDPPRRAPTRFDTHARKGAIEEQARGLLALGAQR